MIRELAAGTQFSTQSDVLVIGAGTVGLVMAARLARLGLHTIVIESGSLDQTADTHELNEVVHLRSPYAGATYGRFRCLGGTSTRWGGALIPYLSSDFSSIELPIEPEELQQYLPQVEALFGLTPGTYDAPEVFPGENADFVARLAKWPPFRKRNVARLLSKEIRQLSNLDIWLNATATRFELSGGLLRTVRAQSKSGGELRVHAREVVIAAGAIESTRILLLMDRQNDGALSDAAAQLGRHFSDHLSLPVAEVHVSDRRSFSALTGFRFERNGSMRNIRFELASTSPLRESIPPCFAHIGIAEDSAGGFDALRELFRRVQGGRIPSVDLLIRLIASTPWLARALWWRHVKHRLLYPDTAKLQLHMVIEQSARVENSISLARSRLDTFGQPLAEISWNVASEDVENLGKAIAAFERAWQSSAMAKMAKLTRYESGTLGAELASSGGIYHPVGSTRIGRSPDLGVVDPDLRPFHVRNASVVSTSVLPRSGGTNPTMTLLMLGLRCVDHIYGNLRLSES